jgi:hypothetical protein
MKNYYLAEVIRQREWEERLIDNAAFEAEQ